MKIPKIDFPKNFNKNVFFTQMVSLFILFSVNPESILPSTIDLHCFNNDFNNEGELVWFWEALCLQSFILLITRAGTILIEDRLVKSLFYALFIDSIFSIFNTLIFGYSLNEYSLIIRNLTIILAMSYAYYILFDGTDRNTWETR